MFKKNKYVVFVLGAPGAGKRTLCQKVCEDFDVEHISPSVLFRNETQGSDAHAIQKCLAENKLVPAKITVKLLQRAINTCTRQKIIIDGFPRNSEGRKLWDSAIGRNIQLKFVLFLECPLEVSLQRCLSRPGKRLEDTQEVVQRKIQNYIDETNPLLEYFGRKSLLKTANGAKTPKEIYNDVRIFFENFNKEK